MKFQIVLAGLAIALTGCVTTPQTPKDVYLNRYAGAQAVAMNCPAFGGYGSVAAMRTDAEKNLAQAKALGATEKEVAQTQQRVNGNLMGATLLVGDLQACQSFMGSLAWAGSSPAIVKPIKKPPN